MNRFYLLLFVFCLVRLSVNAQSPTADFVLDKSSYCLLESLTIDNNSTNANSYTWDFCEGDLLETPTASTTVNIADAGVIFGIDVVSDGNNYFGFVTSRTNNKIFRLDYGASQQNTPVIVDLDNIDNLLNGPEPIVIVEELGNWYGFVHNGSARELIRLDFGNNLSNIPSAEVVFSNVGVVNSGMDFAQTAGGNYALITNFSNNTISIIDFGSSVSNNPDVGDIFTTSALSGAAGLIDINMIEYEGNWYGVSVGFSSRSIHTLQFGTDVFSQPVVTNVSGSILAGNNPYRIELARDNGNFIGFIANNGGDLINLDFGSDIADGIDNSTNHGNLGVFSLPYSLAFQKENSTWYGFSINSSGKDVNLIEFPDICANENPTSNDFQPEFINYTEPGTYNITLTAIDGSNRTSSQSQSITVLNTSAPPAQLIIDASRCIDNMNVLAASSTVPDVTYSWDLDDDGMEDANTQIVNYQFPSTGTFSVDLVVQSTNGCSNSLTQEIEIFPAPSTPDYDFSATALCTSTQIDFINLTDETGLESVISYQWDFDGEGNSSDKNPSFEFESSGNKNVSLIASIPGCSSDPYSEVLAIVDGPEVNFSFTNNCFGEAIQFTDASTGSGITGYSWDFGDGSPIDNNQNPTHTFANENDYTVTLTVTNDNGCMVPSSQVISVSDDPIVDFNSGSAVENLPISFDGLDLTGSQDNVVQWNWDFDGLGSSTDQNTNFVFQSDGAFNVSLTVQTAQGCSEQIQKTINVDASQFPTIDFQIPTEVCLLENLELINNSVNAQSYSWDFCEGDLLETPEASTSVNITDAAGIFGIDVVFDGINYFSFVTSRANNKIFRLDYGASLKNTPVIVDLGNVNNLFDDPEPIAIVEELGNWYGIIHNGASQELVRLDFGNSLTNSPTAETVFSSLGGANSGMDFVQTANGNYALITNFSNNTISIIDFGSSVSNNPDVGDIFTTSTLSGAAGLIDINMIEYEGNWYGVSIGFSSRSIHTLQFGTDVFSQPVVTNVSGSILVGNNPYRIEMERDNGKFIGFIANNGGDLINLDFGSDIADGIDNSTNHGNLGVLSLPYSLAFQKENSTWYGFSINSNVKDVYLIQFPDLCASENPDSNEFQPNFINYTEPGTYNITLTAIDGSNRSSSQSQSISVLSTSAPPAQISIDESRCIDNVNVLAASSTVPDVTYSWDLDDDGMEDANTQTVNYQFPSIGTFNVNLVVQSTNGCANSLTQEIEIFPAPSTPDFDFSAAALCTSTQIDFINLTDETGLESVISYQWDFDGEGNSSDKNPSFEFESSGNKNVSLIASIPGCTSDSYSEVLAIVDGPEVNFSFTNNCFGEAIQFTDASTGSGITGYSWDFGDGSPVDNNQNPTHTFASENDFTVTLTVTNDNGCMVPSSQVISVSDDPIVDFNSGSAVENLPISFDGLDLTGSQDNVVQWNWDFNGLGSSTDQNTNFVFQSDGAFNVSLTVQTAQGCSEQIQKTINVDVSQFPTIDFQISDEVCLLENLELVNNSVNAQSYLWDFCEGDLLELPEVDNLINLGSFSPYGIEMVHDDLNYYAFLVGKASDNIIRLDFGTSFQNTPVIVDLGNVNDLLDGPEPIVIVEENGDWYGFVHNGGSQELIRLNFGSDLSSSPTAETVYSGVGGDNSGMDFVQSANGNYALITGFSTNTISIIDFGSSVSNNPEVGDIFTSSVLSGAAGLIDINMIENEGNWYGVTVGFSSRTIHTLEFGTDILSQPVVTNVSGSILIGNQPYRVEVERDNGKFIGFIANNGGDLINLDFGSDISDGIELATNLGKFGLLNNTWSLALHKESSSWQGITVDALTREAFSIKFPNPCASADPISRDFEPDFITYSSEGTYNVTLTAIDGENRTSSSSQIISVNNISAPNLEFSIDDSRCISNTNAFEATSNTADLIYSWDIDNDGMEDANTQMVNFQFPNTGTFDVSLVAQASNGCSNKVTQQVSIFPEPPIPGFELTNALVCSNSQLFFNNLSDETEHDSEIIIYTWDFDGVQSSTVTNPMVIFDSGGTKQISLTMSIPGCESFYSENIDVIAGPAIDFSFDNACVDAEVVFDNSTTGNGITGYEWNFGDGNFSTNEDVSHIYLEPGEFELSLTSTNDVGCVNSLSQTIIIHHKPEVSFSSEVPCANFPLQFFDQSTVENANVTSWLWDFGGLGSDENKDPTFNFESTGEYNISLTAGSNFGCESTLVQAVEIITSPTVEFEVDLACLNEISRFTDLTTTDSSNPITSWFWEIDGTVSNDQNPELIFNSFGLKDVSLTITTLNNCAIKKTEEIEVFPLPDASFAIEDVCSNQVTRFIENGMSVVPIVSRVWDFDGLATANGPEAGFQFPSPGEYRVSLTLENEDGCVNSGQSEVEILEAPVAAFTPNVTFGAPPLEVLFENQSSEADSFLWKFNDSENSTSANANPIFTFQETGVFNVRLIASNNFGCNDSTQITIFSDLPVLDLELLDIQQSLIDENIRLSLDIINSGTVRIDGFDIIINIENRFPISERVETTLNAGDELTYTLGVEIPTNNLNIGFICISLADRIDDQQDANLLNNEKCANFGMDPIITSPFPNPTTDDILLQMVLTTQEDVVIELLNIHGEFVYQQTFGDLQTGLNSISIDARNFKKGLYFLRTRIGTMEKNQRILIF